MEILKVIVGSRSHGLATEDSDYDYRGVFQVLTFDMLKIGEGCVKHTQGLEGKEDDTAWELRHFLEMATKCNPTVLETFLAPVSSATPLGMEMRELFPHVWNSSGVKNAFIGYGINQRKKFFDKNDKRSNKYATAYLRVLFNCLELLETGTFSVDIRHTEVYTSCKKFKAGDFTHGEVIETCWQMEERCLKAYERNPDKETNLGPVNNFLERALRGYWSTGECLTRTA